MKVAVSAALIEAGVGPLAPAALMPASSACPAMSITSVRGRSFGCWTVYLRRARAPAVTAAQRAAASRGKARERAADSMGFMA